eukprot:CAMPEP_0196585956 /NCGR_PEP_ID=MMETSP1081-20130531/52686_1 /TAXON_ID=36882 /ORGANISM="Pyramimonas amylifera, Strain CCMP720" /LENGTH=111 /DNA_ID=CAMNT_0041907675 /DNA_START=556 /DNA_END=891 /DNA_ORIENTATION=-
MAGWELKDIVGHLGLFENMSSRISGASSASSGSSNSDLSVVAVISRDPNVWAHLGRVIGITLAIFEVGKLLASLAVSHEVKGHRTHFTKVRDTSFTRIQETSSKKSLGFRD